MTVSENGVVLLPAELCSQVCGARCCRGPGIAELTDDEVERLAGFAVDRGLDVTIVHNVSGHGGHMVLSPENPCAFLNQESNLCTIYDDRPERCRAFPAKANHPGCLLSGWNEPPRIALAVPRSGERMNLAFETSLINVQKFLAKEGRFAGIHERISPVVEDNQNDLVADFLATDAEYLVFLEDDMVFTPNSPSMLVWKMQQATANGVDMAILCGLYFQRTGVPIPHFYEHSGIEDVLGEAIMQHTALTEEVEALLKPLPIPVNNQPYALGPEHDSILQMACGATGFTAVRRDVFETVPYPWVRRMGGRGGTSGGTAADFAFFYRAREFGFDVYGDVGIGAGHLSLQPVGTESFTNYRAKVVAVEQAERRTPNG